MAKAKQPLGPPMTLGNMRDLGVSHLIAPVSARRRKETNHVLQHIDLADPYS
jgi:hypothetical protein